MPTLTKDQQKGLIEKLDTFFDIVYLLCDGYAVSACLRRTGTNKLEIVTSVNGFHFKGEWYNSDNGLHEVAKRFWRIIKKQKLSAKELRAYERAWGKKWCRKRGLYEPHLFPTPHWLRPAPFIRHLLKNNESVEEITYETYKAKLKEINGTKIDYQQERDNAA